MTDTPDIKRLKQTLTQVRGELVAIDKAAKTEGDRCRRAIQRIDVCLSRSAQ